MLEGLCGKDEKKWKEVLDAGRVAIESRINLWDGMYTFTDIQGAQCVECLFTICFFFFRAGIYNQIKANKL